MKKRRLIQLLVIGLVMSMLFAGCPRTESVNEEIKIGVVAPFDGSNAHIGQLIMNSVELYFSQHQVANVPIKIIPIDTKSNPANATAALQSAIADSKLKAIIGFYHSSTASACKTIIQESKIPTLIYSASNPEVTSNAPYYFRLVPTDDNQSIVLADYAKQLGASRIGILYYADEYGKGLMDGVKQHSKEIGLDVVDIQSYDSSTNDFRPILTVMKGKQPEIIMICGFVEKSIAIINQAAEKGLKATFLCGDGTFNEQQLIQGTGKNSEGVYVAAPYVFDETNARNRVFLESYWKKYDISDNPQKPASWTVFAYDAAGIISHAIGDGKKERASITEYLQKMTSADFAYNGITGPIFFNENGDVEGRTFRLAVVKNQQFNALAN